ncbi:MAG TPA: hypothetical protein VJC12_00850 [Candidatus Paceibacterota bacterium]
MMGTQNRPKPSSPVAEALVELQSISKTIRRNRDLLRLVHGAKGINTSEELTFRNFLDEAVKHAAEAAKGRGDLPRLKRVNMIASWLARRYMIRLTSFLGNRITNFDAFMVWMRDYAPRTHKKWFDRLSDVSQKFQDVFAEEPLKRNMLAVVESYNVLARLMEEANLEAGREANKTYKLRLEMAEARDALKALQSLQDDNDVPEEEGSEIEEV